MTAIPNSQPKEVFNYKEYLEFMESKKVRHGAERTNTLLDFVTAEQQRADNEKVYKILALTIQHQKK